MAEFLNSEVRQTADRIECYLKTHPNAADTAEGISKWWLIGQQPEVSSLIVHKALEYLISKSIVKCSSSPGGNKIYSKRKSTA